jgi:hypothetical protein
MEYQGYVVRTFEREPGKWRAKILRSVGKSLVTGRNRIVQFVTGADRTTPSAALLVALEAIDAGAFSRPATLPEKFWHRRGQRSNGPISDDALFLPRSASLSEMVLSALDRVDDQLDPYFTRALRPCK